MEKFEESLVLIKYLDFHNDIKCIVEYNQNYFLANYTNMVFEEISWQKNGSTAVLIIIDQDAKELIYIDQMFIKLLKEELIDIEDNQLNNARNLLKTIPD